MHTLPAAAALWRAASFEGLPERSAIRHPRVIGWQDVAERASSRSGPGVVEVSDTYRRRRKAVRNRIRGPAQSYPYVGVLVSRFS